MLVTLNNEVFVRLKYKIATNNIEFSKYRSSYPEQVHLNLKRRWAHYKNVICNGVVGTPVNRQWKLYLKWLVEELCEYESSINNV